MKFLSVHTLALAAMVILPAVMWFNKDLLANNQEAIENLLPVVLYFGVLAAAFIALIFSLKVWLLPGALKEAWPEAKETIREEWYRERTGMILVLSIMVGIALLGFFGGAVGKFESSLTLILGILIGWTLRRNLAKEK